MIKTIYLSGEGASDLGSCRDFNAGQGGCTDGGFKPGPMTELLIKLLRSAPYPEVHADWLPETMDATIDSIQYIYIPRGELGRFVKSLNIKNQFRPSARTPKGMGADAMQAFALGSLAKEGNACLAVLFHDVDGVNGESLPKKYSLLRQAYGIGFERSGYPYGVRMIPMPRSEGWLVCAADGYVNCQTLENRLSGNDRSPWRSAKTVLAERLRATATTEVQINFVVNNVDPNRLYEMTSFKDFADELVEKIVARIN